MDGTGGVGEACGHQTRRLCADTPLKRYHDYRHSLLKRSCQVKESVVDTNIKALWIPGSATGKNRAWLSLRI